ncbi:winged helix-turn-helix transcriptional regulator [Paenibacillus sp. GCM10027627]|uniref:winged helix-turn-helix transcriptional regulator n=1 Tax=unclassified Paenibacillus TaxID=185978 RepID=UPI00363347C8
MAEHGVSYLFNGKTFQCPIEVGMSLFSGRWKSAIICKLVDGKKRYGQLKKLITGITHKMLAEQLRELESANIISRTVYPTTPPKVEYELTPLGKSLLPAIEYLQQWGEQFRLTPDQDSP